MVREQSRTRLANIIRENEHIEFRDQQEIVDTLNGMFDIRNDGIHRVRIIYYNGVTWACLRQIDNPIPTQQRLEIYNSVWPDAATTNAIANWLGMYAFPLRFARCMPSDAVEEFLVVLAKAVNLAFGRLPYYFYEANIREAIARIIQMGELRIETVYLMFNGFGDEETSDDEDVLNITIVSR